MSKFQVNDIVKFKSGHDDVGHYRVVSIKHLDYFDGGIAYSLRPHSSSPITMPKNKGNTLAAGCVLMLVEHHSGKAWI